MRATKPGRWALRAAVVLAVGFGGAMGGVAAAQAESSWDCPTVDSVTGTGAPQAGGDSLATANESSWD
jgi:hypothetical protein